MKSRLVPVLLAGTVLVSACGGDVDSGEAAPGGSAGDATVPSLPEPAEGPAPDLPIAAGSLSSPLPDVVVRQLNREGGWVQLKNLVPSDRPVLLWFWAPF